MREFDEWLNTNYGDLAEGFYEHHTGRVVDHGVDVVEYAESHDDAFGEWAFEVYHMPETHDRRLAAL